jgi:hypothetical protein
MVVMIRRLQDAARKVSSSVPRNPEVDFNSVRPFGLAGVGLLTEHPVGLLVIIGIFVVALAALPPARAFFLLVLPVGGIIGYFLWLHHR